MEVKQLIDENILTTSKDQPQSIIMDTDPSKKKMDEYENKK